jgi:hypothetical protein
MFTLSINMLPDEISVSLNNEANNELLPAPVRPTTPIFSAGRVTNVTSRNDGTR